jgi:hypothetical protein
MLEVQVAWTTNIFDVVMVDEVTYTVLVSPLNINEPGANEVAVLVDYVLVDYVGNNYRIISVGVVGAEADRAVRITVLDETSIGVGPQSGQYGFIAETAETGNAIYVTLIRQGRLDKSALDTLRILELESMWRRRGFAWGTDLNITKIFLVGLTGVITEGSGWQGGSLFTITNPYAFLGGVIHTPVADLTGAKAVVTNISPDGHIDKMIMLIETLGLYRYDTESMAVSDDVAVIRPTDIVSDGDPGRWLKLGSDLVKNTGAEIDIGTDDSKFSTAKSIRDSGLISGAVSGEIYGLTDKPTPIDADVIMIEDSFDTYAKKKITWANIKATLKSYFDTLYNNYVHPNHSGDVTSVGDGATTIANGVVSNAKLADMATQTFKCRKTAGTGPPEDVSLLDTQTMLGLFEFDVYIDFLDTTPFVYNCPYALKFTTQISESTAATLSVALNTNMAQFDKLTVTPAVIGLVILKGILL